MLDLAWSEILLIAVVALVVIGPKDLPGAIRGIADFIKTGKQKLASFQQQADELVKEAKLDEVRNQIADVKGALNEIRNFDLKGEITKAVDSDGTLTKTFSESPLGGSSTPAWTPPPTARDTPDAPPMIPPQTMAPYKAPEPLPTPPPPDMPSFLPPSTPAPLNVAPPPVAPLGEPAPVPASVPEPLPAAPSASPPAAAIPSPPAAEAAAKSV